MLNFNKNNQKQWLSIIRKQGIGPKTFWKLYDQDASFYGVERVDVQNELDQHARLNFNLCAGFEDIYPQTLYDLVDAPPIFSYAGMLDLLSKPCIAIVGARNASPGGKKIAFDLAQKLGKAGFVIVSGLARGIDGAAHEGALDTGTIAVLAGGIDQIYPPEHRKLYEQISKDGCILSEMPLGTAPAAPLFPRRNRIIAALCQGIVVIEAAHQSGTLITVQHAVEMGRDVFVVPGSPLDPRSRGGNNLIKQGAILVETADDILAYYINGVPVLRTLSKSIDKTSRTRVSEFNTCEIKVDETHVSELDVDDLAPQSKHMGDCLPNWLATLGLDPISVEDILAQHPTIIMSSLFATLAKLEMDGVITRFPDGRIARRF